MPGGFAVPFSSTPPSTPDSTHRRSNGLPMGNRGLVSNPSTTPAGPPPSTASSFLPSGFPTSSFSNLQEKPRITAFNPKIDPDQRSPANMASSPAFKANNPDLTSSASSPYRRLQNVPSFAMSKGGSSIGDQGSIQSLDQSYHGTRDSEDDIGQDEYSEESDMGVENDISNRHIAPSYASTPKLRESLISSNGLEWANFGTPTKASQSRGQKRSLVGASLLETSSRQNKPLKRRRKDSAIPNIARDFSKRLGVARVKEPDKLIIGTERTMGNLYALEDSPERSEQALEDALPVATEDLCRLWRDCRKLQTQDRIMDDNVEIGIGPSESAPSFQKAEFVAPLLLQLRHPPTTVQQAFDSSRNFRPSSAMSLIHSNPPGSRTKLFPKILADWLEEHHNAYATAAVSLQLHQPDPTSHANFWDILLYLILHGRVFDAINILKKSDFQYARTARSDKHSQSSYSNVQLRNIGVVIGRAIEALGSCPTIADGDWRVTGPEWAIYRKRLQSAVSDLTLFAEGRDRDHDPLGQDMRAPDFGIQNTNNTLSQSSRRAESQVPWTVYQNLKAMYGILLGKSTEIISSAQDWVEATVALTMWWNGDDDEEDFVSESIAHSQRALRHSEDQGNRTVDINPTAAYLRRLVYAFERVTDEEDDDSFQINSTSDVQVGLATLFEGDIEGTVGLLQSWSLPVASAVAEILNLGGWVASPPRTSVSDAFNESDLMVLSYRHEELMWSSDDILVQYAEQLFEIDRFEEFNSVYEGWQLSMELLNRLNNENMARAKMKELLRQLRLTSDKRVDEVIYLCRNFGMESEANSIAERYAESITENSDRYGTALMYYACAHRPERVKDILDLLISLSLVHSSAFPPSSSIDRNLLALLNKTEVSLAQVGHRDREAANILHMYLTGYATLRNFYNLRDGVNLKDSKEPNLRPVALKKAAASALIAVINSAADNIHGGLYDADRGSIVQVDGLLALLGEAMVFVNQSRQILSLRQCFDLLKAIEDLQTVTSRVYEQCEDCFRSALDTASNRSKTPLPSNLLKKTMSNMTSSSSAFSLVNASMSTSSSSKDDRGSGVMVKMINDAEGLRKDDVKRGWDWRDGMSRGAKGQDVLRILRLGLAKDIARAWVEGADP
ncbi:MAG: hypothetical protein Q9167_000174 [Letrouitia subvulpina]